MSFPEITLDSIVFSFFLSMAPAYQQRKVSQSAEHQIQLQLEFES